MLFFPLLSSTFKVYIGFLSFNDLGQMFSVSQQRFNFSFIRPLDMFREIIPLSLSATANRPFLMLLENLLNYRNTTFRKSTSTCSSLLSHFVLSKYEGND
ncbi:hypothetical protein GOODEAATRI_022816 [Goodea atripinnis]|uniref:Maturase K n=1 Tax=Goodea atripinnis TaxID=208336 RepID=A0ABV0NPV9_9TELE